jgi:hypothetical protein
LLYMRSPYFTRLNNNSIRVLNYNGVIHGKYH